MLGLKQLVAAVVIGTTAAGAIGQVKSEVGEGADRLVAPAEFAVFPWDILKASKESYEEAKSCGFNLAGFVKPENLDLVKDAGMQCFVSDDRITARDKGPISDDAIESGAKAVAAGTSTHPAVFGYHVVDEPPAGEPVLRAAKWAKSLEAAAPGKVGYVNFLPIHNDKDVAQAQKNYYAYLMSYMKEVKPRAFSFDHYSLMDDGSIRPTYFAGLEVMRKVSIETGVPFWHVGLANSHFHYVEPSPATLRFQVFVSLAYGAKGIGWFTYTGRDRGNYRSAAIDLAGRRTPTWEMLRDANMTAHRLAATYAKWKSVGAFHTGEVPGGCEGIATSRFVKGVTGTGPFLVGEFRDEQGRPAVVVVNKDLAHSTQFTVKWKDAGKVMRVSALTGRVREWGAEDNWLPPGGGVLLFLAK